MNFVNDIQTPIIFIVKMLSLFPELISIVDLHVSVIPVGLIMTFE